MRDEGEHLDGVALVISREMVQNRGGLWAEPDVRSPRRRGGLSSSLSLKLDTDQVYGELRFRF